MGAEKPYRDIFPEKRELVGPHEYGFMFDGHGAQFRGMGQSIYRRYEVARDVIDRANSIASFDLKTACFDNPHEMLSETMYAQLAIVACNEAYLRVLMEDAPDKLEGAPSYVIGQSLGFLNALHVAGAFGEYGSPESFERLIKLAEFRGRIMQERCQELGESGLMAIDSKGKGREEESTISDLKSYVEAEAIEGVYMAIDTNRNKFVVGGMKKDLVEYQRYINRIYKINGIRGLVLSTSSGAFHTPLMRGVDQELRAYLEEMGIEPCKIPVLTNTLAPAKLISSPEEVIEEMVRLITEPVRGTAMNEYFMDRGIHAYNLGEKRITSDIFIDGEGDSLFEQVTSKRALAIGAGVVAGGVVAYLVNRNRKRN